MEGNEHLLLFPHVSDKNSTKDITKILSEEELEEISKFIKESKMGYNGINHGMGWPGNDTFPKWAIDIIMFRNKCFDNDIMDICHKYNCSLDIAYMSIKSKYEHIDKSLNEMIKFIESNSK